MNPIHRELGPLLIDLGVAGVELGPHPTNAGRLRHRPAALRSDLSARLRLHRDAVLGLLKPGFDPVSGGDAEASYIFHERLGIADGLGMPTHSGSAAWLIALGESIRACCYVATNGVHNRDGGPNRRDSDGSGAERSKAIGNRQGSRCAPKSTLATTEWPVRDVG
jgi:hypothetical protein